MRLGHHDPVDHVDHAVAGDEVRLRDGRIVDYAHATVGPDG